jgi:hypothetical protein
MKKVATRTCTAPSVEETGTTMTPSKFLEHLKDPEQAMLKATVIKMLENPETYVYNVDYQQLAEDDYRIVVSFSAK